MECHRRFAPFDHHGQDGRDRFGPEFHGHDGFGPGHFGHHGHFGHPGHHFRHMGPHWQHWHGQQHGHGPYAFGDRFFGPRFPFGRFDHQEHNKWHHGHKEWRHDCPKLRMDMDVCDFAVPCECSGRLTREELLSIIEALSERGSSPCSTPQSTVPAAELATGISTGSQDKPKDN